MRGEARGALALATALACGPAAAQSGAQGAAEDAPLVEELIVRGDGGPPWWRVADGDTTLYILASPGSLPSGLTWNRLRLDGRLQGASLLILPPDGRPDLSLIARAPKLFLKIGRLIKAGETLEPSLPAPVRSRFAAARQRLGQPASRYGAKTPGTAALLLSGDAYLSRIAPAPAPPPRGPAVEAVAEAAAKAAGVRVDHAGNLGPAAISAMLDDIGRPGMDCLTSVLDEVENPPAAPPPPADEGVELAAWAQGDIRPLLEARRRRPIAASVFSFRVEGQLFRGATPECWAAMTGTRSLGERWMALELDALKDALRRPGHAVAVVPASSLLSQDGVLDRLRRQGFTVTPPSPG